MPFAEPAERLNVSMVKNQSRKLVFRHIFHHAPVTRADITTSTALSHGTVKTVMDEFLDVGIVREEKDTTAQVGRKPFRVTVRREAFTFAVVSIRPGRADVHLLDLNLQPIGARRSYPLKQGAGFGESLRRVFTAIAETRVDFGPIASLGLVVPGIYDEEQDRIIGHLLPELAETPISETIRAVLPIPIYIGEDVHLAAFAETSEPFALVQPMFYLYAGAGVGGSYIDEGRVLYGGTKMAGEIGQMLMDDDTRLEERIRWPAFLHACGIEGSDDDATDVRTVVTRLNAGETRALAALQSVVHDTARALGSMVCLMNPKTIVMGGPYGSMGERFLDPLRTKLKAALMPEHADGLVVQASQAGDQGMIRGAAVRALEQWMDTLFLGGQAT